MSENNKQDISSSTIANEPAALTYGMSQELRDSGLLSMIQELSHEDKKCLIRFIHETDTDGFDEMDDLDYNLSPYTMDELNARIDEAEKEIEQGGGKSFEEMMNGFRNDLLWLK